MVVTEKLLASPAMRFPDFLEYGELFREILDLDEFADNEGTSKYLYNATDETVEIRIASVHLDKMIEYLDFKLGLPTVKSNFNVVVWEPKLETQNRSLSIRVDNMGADSEMFWNALLAICYGDD